MARRKTTTKTTTPAPQGGVPYTIDGKRVTLAEYRKWAREQNRQAIVAELRNNPADPDEPAE